MKPVQTGCLSTKGMLRSPDLDFCLRAGGMSADAASYDSMCPYRFVPACSPHLAARQVGDCIDLDRIALHFDSLRRRFEVVLVEGAGGILVPLDEETNTIDLVKQLDLPVVVATRPGLGTLNHTLLTLSYLREHGARIAGVAFVESEPATWGDIECDNRATVERLGCVPVLGIVPHLGDLDPLDPPAKKLASAGDALLDALQSSQ
jgi:dethiobiotin synthetase